MSWFSALTIVFVVLPIVFVSKTNVKMTKTIVLSLRQSSSSPKRIFCLLADCLCHRDDLLCLVADCFCVEDNCLSRKEDYLRLGNASPVPAGCFWSSSPLASLLIQEIHQLTGTNMRYLRFKKFVKHYAFDSRFHLRSGQEGGPRIKQAEAGVETRKIGERKQ
jgi:hypothetical protein